MLWLLIYLGLFLGLTLGLYQILRRFEAVRRVVVSYHVLVVLLAVLIFIIMAQAEGLIRPDFLKTYGAFGDFLIGAVVFFAALVALRLADLVLVGHLLGKRLGIAISVIARHIAIVILLAVTLIVVLTQAGWEIGPLLATSAIGTAIIGLALQDVLGNVIAGVALQAEHPFKVGDWVQIGEYMGQVIEMNWRATRLATLDSDHVILPNSTVAREKIRNFNSPNPVEARHLEVGVEYGAPPGKVKAVLLEAAQGAEGVLSHPAPQIWVVDYGDFAITYEIKFWLDRFVEHHEIQDNVMTRIWYLFKRNNITIPFPIRNIFHHGAGQVFARDVLRPGSEEVTGILRSVDLLQALSDEEVNTLSSRLEVAIFTAGEALVRQADAGDSFLIISDGEVSVRVNNTEVATLSDRDHFGEMSLLTGEPRSATVVAVRDTRVLVIDRECFETVLKGNPAVVEKMSEVLERIHAENLEKLKARGVADREAKPTSARSLLTRVRKFFRLP